MKRSCERCEYYDKEKHVCRVQPPQTVDQVYGTIGTVWRFPVVKKNDWCGWFEEREVEK
ncbi:MAG: hypothetical protein ACYS1A_20290 [Planctomycetota bacterium]|jgi:hypothetical protein